MPLPMPLPDAAAMPLVEITEAGFDVHLDIVYATAANLTGRPIYARAACWLHPEAAAALRRAVAIAAMLGLRLRLFDGFRPAAAQERLWRALPDPAWIADPRTGSHHTRGIAVDLTLAGPDGVPLDLGTGFDAMTPRSQHGRTDLPAEALRNRVLLLGVMGSAGWQPYAGEWWHYQLPDPAAYPLITDRAAVPGLMAEDG